MKITESQNNTYGSKCSENCGKCMHGEQCHHVNGSYLDGCDKGRKGVKVDSLICWVISKPAGNILVIQRRLKFLFEE